MIDPESLWINVRFDQMSAAGLAGGLPARIVLRSRDGQTLQGRVLRVEPMADAVTEETLAKASFDTRPESLPPVGELAEVTVELPALPAAPRVGRTATRAIVASVLASLLAGCAVGPDFKRPAAPTVATYTEQPLPAETLSAPVALGQALRFADAPVDAAWWQRRGPPKLSALIDAAFEASPTLASAHSTLRQAQELHAARAGFDALSAGRRRARGAAATAEPERAGAGRRTA